MEPESGACRSRFNRGGARMKMELIAAADEAWGIGLNGRLLRRISADMKRFRAMTLGNVLVIGRKTLESFPGGRPLPGRGHIVLTNNRTYAAEGVTLCHALDGLPELLREYEGKRVFVAGGGSVYRQLLPFCERAYITRIYDTFPADTFLPNLDREPEWRLAEKGEIQEEDGVRFSFDVYERK